MKGVSRVLGFIVLFSVLIISINNALAFPTEVQATMLTPTSLVPGQTFYLTCYSNDQYDCLAGFSTEGEASACAYDTWIDGNHVRFRCIAPGAGSYNAYCGAGQRFSATQIQCDEDYAPMP